MYWREIRVVLEEEDWGIGRKWKNYGKKVRVVLPGDQRGIARRSERNWEKIMLLLVQYDEENRRGREIY